MRDHRLAIADFGNGYFFKVYVADAEDDFAVYCDSLPQALSILAGRKERSAPVVVQHKPKGKFRGAPNKSGTYWGLPRVPV